MKKVVCELLAKIGLKAARKKEILLEKFCISVNSTDLIYFLLG